MQPEAAEQRPREHLDLQSGARGRMCALTSPPGEAERRRLLFEWNDTAADYPRDRGVHEIFAERAAATPDAPAVSCGRDRLTYGELDRRANQVSSMAAR